MVINGSNDGEEENDNNPIDAARASLKTSEIRDAKFTRLRNVDSVQQLAGKDQDINFMEGYDDVSLYHQTSGVENAKSPSMMILSKGDKQVLEDYAKQYNSKLSRKQNKSPGGTTILHKMPHTTKHLKDVKLKMGLATRTTEAGYVDDSSAKMNTEHSTVNSNNILLQQGVAYSSMDKSLVRLPLIGGTGQTTSPQLPLISGTGQTTSPLHTNMGG